MICDLSVFVLYRSWCELLSDKLFCFTLQFLLYSLCISKTSQIPKRVICLFKGCWRISTSRRMKTKYASSLGKAKPLLWTSLKPSHQWLSWGDWHCHYFWRRTAGNCTWEPGFTGHCWAGCGWTFFLNKNIRGCHNETHKRHGETVPFSCIRSTQGVFQMQSSVWLRGSDLSHMSGSLLTLSWKLRCGGMLSFLCYWFPHVVWICSLKWWENMSGFIQKYYISLNFPLMK